MTHARPAAALVLLPLLLGNGCASSSLDDLPPALRRSAITSIQNPLYRAIEPGPWTWLPGSFVRSDPRIDHDKVDGRIRRAIRRALEGRGFRFTESNDSRYIVGYAGQLRGSPDNIVLDAPHALKRPQDAIERHDPHQWDSGNLVIDIADRRTQVSVWRGASEVLVAFGLDDATSTRRTNALVAAMIERMRLR